MLRAYLNGSPQGTAQPASLSAVSGTLQIGAWVSGSGPADFFSGTIDEVRVFNRTLTQTEIGDLMNTPVTP